jgi:N-acetylgalactosamine-6-sulfatase
MTGRFPARFFVHGHFATHQMNRSRGMPDWLDPEVATYARLLRETGYRVGHFGKWHLGHGEGAPEPSRYGIDESLVNSGNGPQLEFRREAWAPGLRSQSSRFIVDHAIEFIDKNAGAPFLVNVWLNDTHAILDPTLEQLEIYDDLRPQHVGDRHWGAPAVYYAAATEADRQIGRLLDHLDRLGLAENTAVIFSSDNGPEDIVIRNASHSGAGSPGPFRGRKRSLYEGGIRTPFILRWPAGGARPGAVDNTTPLCGVDLLPTFCALAGIDPPEELDGENMSDVFRGARRARTTPLYWEWRFRVAGHPINRSPMLAVCRENWKLLLNPDRGRVELCDVVADPMELTNLAGTNANRVDELAEEVLSWQAAMPAGPLHPEAGSNAYPWPGA